MSRAVQRKRKRLSKKQMSSMERNSDLPHMDGDSDPEGEDEDEFGEHVIDTESSKIRLLPDNDDSEEAEEDQARDITNVFDAVQLSVTEIVNLKDGDDLSSTEKATLLLSKLLNPIDLQEFYKCHWEKSALLCSREDEQFFKKIITRKILEGVFSKQLLFEGVNVSFIDPLTISVSNIPVSEEDENEDNDNTSDAEGNDGDEEVPPKEIKSSEIWENYNKGLTVKLLTPQVYIDSVWKLLSVLEHEFQSRVSAEVVLAPPLERQSKSAPTQARPGSVAAKLNSDDKIKVKAHVSAVPYDNVNAFVLQLEGQSRWRAMPNPHAKLNLATDGGAVALKDIDEWSKPVIDTVLTPGQSLYIPKGWVYQQDNHGTDSSADPASQHSLHLKICCTHGTTGTTGDLLHLLVPEALGEAVQAHVALRSALPKGYHRHLGLAASEVENDKKRARLQKHISELLQIVADRALEILDPAVDQIQKQFIAARLPVPLSAREEACSAAGAPQAVVYPYTALRMVRPGLATAVVEDGKVVVYHCMDNSRELFGTALSPVEFELDDGPAIEALLAAYPDSVTVSDLEHPSEELDDKIGVAQALFKEGFLLITDEVSKPSVGPPPKKPAGAAAMTKNLKKRVGDVPEGKKKKHVQEPDDDDPF